MKPPSAFQRFIHHEATAGGLLTVAALLAVIVSNSSLADGYHEFLNWPVSFGAGPYTLHKSMEHFINDGLMAVFFFAVGLELKREVLQGNLSDSSQIVLPAVAALGGMAAPALIYAWLNHGMPTIVGWAIPAATDIAFALGALAIAGSKVPPSVKVFLLTLATLDDLGAILIIALFYTSDISTISLLMAALCFSVLIIFNRLKIDRTAPYILVGLIMWVFVLKSGVHATFAGVLLALTIPLNRNNGKPMLLSIEESIHPYVSFGILPLFAFANAGIPLSEVSLSSLSEPLPLGITAGLTLGKPIGILAAIAFCVALKFAGLPKGANWMQTAGVSCLAGIGFTMSLFIGGLAFEEQHISFVRMGVIAGSLLSLALGTIVLLLAPKPKQA